MKPNKLELIRQIDWLLERMARGQVLRVLSYANRIFTAEGPDGGLQRPSEPTEQRGRDNP